MNNRPGDDWLPEARSQILSNDLRVVAVELPHLHTAAVAGFVRAGSRFESPQNNGLSHFVEHMLFRGTASYPTSRDLAIAVENLGSTLEAETGRDLSVFHMLVTPELTGDAVALLGDILGRPRFAEIDLERSIILEELGADFDEDGAETQGEDIARELLFGDHPLGQRVIGSPKNIRRFDQKDIQAHFTRHYCAANAAVCIAGPLTAQTMFARARECLTALPTGRSCEIAPPHFDQSTPRYRYVRTSGSQTDVHVLFRAIADVDPQYMASVAFLRAIDDGMATPLHYELCDRRGLAYSVGASLEPLADVAVLEISGSAGQGNVPELLRGMLDIVGRFRDELIGEAELLRIKRRYRNDLFSAMDDPFAMANWFGSAALYYPPPSPAERKAQIDAIRPEDIRSAARRIARPGRLAVAIVGPLSRARQGEAREIVNEWR